MSRKQPPPGKKFFTPQQANQALPLVRAIVQDITALARELKDRHERLGRQKPAPRGGLGKDYDEEWRQMHAEFVREQERMAEYERELGKLGVELKDYFTGLVDFPCRMDGREVYLCWRLGEPEVAHWHETDAGFAGRQRLQPSPAAK